MRFYVTVVSAPGILHSSDVKPSSGPLAGLGSGAVELAVDMDQGTGGQLLERELASALQPGARFWVDGFDLRSLTAGQMPFINGAVIIAAPAQWPPFRRPPGEHNLFLATLSGPDSGQLVALKRGSYTLGRSDCDINFADPALSRVHAQLSVTPTAVAVRDQNSTNGLRVDGVRRTTALMTTNSTLALGSTSCALRFSGPQSEPVAESADIAEPLVVPRADAAQHRGRLLVLAGLPLLIGVGLAWLTGSWMFLAFSAMSATTILMPAMGGLRRRKAFRTALREAVEAEDLRRARVAPPLSAVIAHVLDQAHNGGTGVSPAPLRRPREQNRHTTADSGHLRVRVGTADQPANIRLEPPDSNFVPPILNAAPVMIDLVGLDELRIIGAPLQIAALARSVVLQLTAFPASFPLRIILAGAPQTLPLSARFLPGVVLATTRSALHQRLANPVRSRTVLMIFDSGLADSAGRERLAQLAAQELFTVIWCSADHTCMDSPVLRISETTAFLQQGTSLLAFVPDLIGVQTFDRYSRTRPKVIIAAAPGMEAVPDGFSPRDQLPQICPLDSVSSSGSADIASSWRNPPEVERLEAILGLGSSGPVLLDLQQDGPHVLIAGTTGSGKSELLRTLVLSLAQRYSPERMSLLFVDYKGGSGLGPLEALPHCVGMLTDLSTEAVSRALVSLKAEVKHRERLLASLQADNVATYRRLAPASAEPLPHLVLVIDEFLMLKEEVPGAVDELVRIATVGRSLGIHLVLATQRPQGAISADIRANVTTTVALRVRTGFESQDLIDIPDAATLSADVPGRAYLKRSGAPPIEFQSASASRATDRAARATLCRVQGLHQSFADDGGAAAPGVPRPEAALHFYIDQVFHASEGFGGFSVRHPVAPALPVTISESAHVHLPGPKDGPTSIQLGILDLPALQRVEGFNWQPAVHSHLALIGSGASGIQNGMRRILTRWLQHPATRNHLYVLDADGSLASVRSYPQVGSYVGSDDIRLAARVLQRLAEVLTERISTSGTANRTLLALVINGWGRWMTAIRTSPWAWAEDTLQDLVRDGASAGIAILITGDRELVSGRFFAAIPNRVYLPAGASPESRLMWPRLPAMDEVPGRAFVQGPMVPEPGIAQLAQLSQPDDINPLSAAKRPRKENRPGLPFRIGPLPWRVEASSLQQPVSADGKLLLGVAGDDPQPAAVPLGSAEVLLIIGPPRSGRTNALAVLQELNRGRRLWVRCDSADPTVFWNSFRRSSTAAPAETIASTVLLIDDADRLPPGAHADVAALQGCGYAVVMTAASGQTMATRIPLAMQARNTGRGVLLMPQTAFDGDFFGVRTEVEPRFIPGRAVIIDAGRAVQLQLALASVDIR